MSLESKRNPFMEYYPDYEQADTWGKIKPYLQSKWNHHMDFKNKSLMKSKFETIHKIFNLIQSYHTKKMKIEFHPYSSMHWFNAIATNNQTFMNTLYINESKILTPYGHFQFRFDKPTFKSNYKLHQVLQKQFNKKFTYETTEISGWTYILFPISDPFYLFPSDTFIENNLIPK